jgi:hypothetical protein
MGSFSELYKTFAMFWKVFLIISIYRKLINIYFKRFSFKVKTFNIAFTIFYNKIIQSISYLLGICYPGTVSKTTVRVVIQIQQSQPRTHRGFKRKAGV